MATRRRLKPKPRPRKHTLLRRPPLFKAGFQPKNTCGKQKSRRKKNTLKTQPESLVTKPRCRGVISRRVYFVAPKATQAPAALWCRWMLKMPVMFKWRSYKSRNSWGATWWTFLTWDSMGYCVYVYIYIYILFFDFHTMILFYISYIYIISVGIRLICQSEKCP